MTLDRTGDAKSALVWSGAILIIVAGLVALYNIDPHQPGHFPTCPFLSLTGLYCPGCGSMRATHCLLHGRFGDAIDRNILALVLLPVAGWALLVDFERRWVKPKVPYGSGEVGEARYRISSLPLGTPKVVLVIVVMYWILRNLPWWPFTLLAPH